MANIVDVKMDPYTAHITMTFPEINHREEYIINDEATQVTFVQKGVTVNGLYSHLIEVWEKVEHEG